MGIAGVCRRRGSGIATTDVDFIFELLFCFVFVILFVFNAQHQLDCGVPPLTGHGIGITASSVAVAIVLGAIVLRVGQGGGVNVDDQCNKE
jgi:hypothetical protein